MQYHNNASDSLMSINAHCNYLATCNSHQRFVEIHSSIKYTKRSKKEKKIETLCKNKMQQRSVKFAIFKETKSERVEK